MSKQSHFAIATRRPVAVLMVVMAVCVFGYVSYQKLSLTLMPDISYPTLTVRTEYPGTAPQDVETQVSERLEEQLAILQGLNRITSISKADQSDILLEFAWGKNMNDATQDIREKLDRVRLPRDAKRPLVLRYDPTLDPIMRIGLTGPYTMIQLRLYAEEIVQRSLEGEEGVAAVQVKGGLEEEFQVRISEDRLVALNLDIQQVNSRLAQNNVNLPGGRLNEGRVRYAIRTLNEFKSVEDIGEIVVARKGGVDIQLKDIAEIEKSHKEKEIETLVNGQPSVEIEIYKDADANIVEVAANVREKLYGTPAQRAFAEALGEIDPQTDDLDDDGKPLNRREKIERDRKRRQMMDYVAEKVPEGCELQVLTDQSIFIKQSIDEVKGNAVVGGCIAILVIFLFLRKLGHTLIIGITIPVSIIATFAPMQLSGVSLNIISLGGLALGVGMLVDNSIVVLESIFRCREEGDDYVKSTVRGVSEVGGAVVASTLTTIAVFFPIVFVEGVAGQVFGDMSLVVVFSLLASLVVALYFIPMLASRQFSNLAETEVIERTSILDMGFFRESIRKFTSAIVGYIEVLKRRNLFIAILGWPLFPVVLAVALVSLPFRIVAVVVGRIIWAVVLLVVSLVGLLAFVGKLALTIIQPLLNLFDFAFQIVYRFYSSLLRWALDNKIFIVGGAFATFALAIQFIFPLLGRELIPKVSQGEFNLEVKMPVGKQIEDTAEVVRSIEKHALENPYVDRTAVVVGTEGGATSDSDEGEHSGVVTVLLDSEVDPSLESVVLEDLRQYVSDIPDVKVEVTYPELFSVKAPIEVELYGHDLEAMRELSQRVVEELSAIDGIVDVQSSVQKGNPEVGIVYDRQRLSQLDLQLKNVAELVRNKVQGYVPTTFRKFDRQVDILVRLREEDRFGIDDLKNLVVNPRGQAPIPLSSIAEMKIREGPNEIRHLDQLRGAVISASVEGIDLSEAIYRIENALFDIEYPRGFTYNVTGQAAEMERSLNSLLFAVVLAIFLVYIVMASQFESLLHPFIILFTVPLAIIGVLAALYLIGSSINILVFIGLIMLTGIVVNNAIVLVDYINKLRAGGMEKLAAVQTACQRRLRPILMTTMTTVLGLIPMALGLGEGSEIRVPLAITVIAGLTSSTFLTLVVIPSIYLLVDRKEHVTQKEVTA